MFGFSIQKLLFTVLVIVIVWYGFKWLARLQDRRENKVAERRRRAGRGRRPDTSADVEDLTECVLCGIYVAAPRARSCGREDCPYPG